MEMMKAVEYGNESRVELLLNQGADVNMVRGEYGTELIAAAYWRQQNIVQLLLDRGADVNIVGGQYGTALIAAAYWRQQNIVQLLLDRGADVNIVGGQYGTALIAAAYWTQQNIVQLLLDRGADVNIIGGQHGTALIAAAYWGKQNTVQLLLDRGADVNIVGGQHGTALIAAAYQKQQNIVQLLLDRGADVNIIGGQHGTALIAAAYQKQQHIVQLLLDRGADVNIIGGKYGTALKVAVSKRQEHVVRLLLDRGADLNVGKTALIGAADMVVGDTMALIEAVGKDYMEVVGVLLSRVADVNLVVDGKTALIEAVRAGHVDIVRVLLLDRGVDVNLVVDGKTALIGAVDVGHVDIVRQLLDRGVDVNLVVDGKTALIGAVHVGDVDIVRLLLDRGADANIIGGRDGTALHVAVCQKRQDIVQLLLDRGADVNIVGIEYRTALIAALYKYLGKPNIVRLLLDRGADVNVIRHPDGTALCVAIHWGLQDIVQLFLDRGADVNIVAGNHGTALITAIYRRRSDIVQMLLDRGADVNIVAGNHGTALITAIYRRRSDIVQMLLDRGADVNIVGSEYGTALVTAVYWYAQDIVQMLLDRGAAVNIVGGKYGTALSLAIYKKQDHIVGLLLDRGADPNVVVGDTTPILGVSDEGYLEAVRVLLSRDADVNMVVRDTMALIEAAGKGYTEVVRVLLSRDADVNLVANGKTALIEAVRAGHVNIVRLLLNRGADFNMVVGDTTALIAAMCACQLMTNQRSEIPELLSILTQERDVSIAGGYGTALIAAISELEFKGTYSGQTFGWQWKYLKKLLSSVNQVEDSINTVIVEHGTALTAAISKKKVQLVGLLLHHGADVNRLGGKYGTALGAALAAGLDSKQRYIVIELLLDKGADVNVVSCLQFGSALGHAAYMGDMSLVSFLLKRGADPFHVGGMYCRNALTGANRYPNALDAAQSSGSKAGASLIAVLSNAMKSSVEVSIPPSAPFPMPYTGSCAMLRATATTLPNMDSRSPRSTCSDLDTLRNLHTHAILTAQQADILCAALEEEILVKALVQLVVGNEPKSKVYKNLIRDDVRYFVAQGYDFGLAYAAARVVWRYFNDPACMLMVAPHRGQWIRIAKQIDEARLSSIYRNNSGQEMIKFPYEVLPRRLWDMKSNRVVEFRMLHSEQLAHNRTTEIQFGKSNAMGKTSHPSELPAYWAITHSWEESPDAVETPINQYQWQVPLPRGLNVDSLRHELLSYGIEYAWLDVLCLRQHSPSNRAGSQISAADLNNVKQEEWKLDVPTIGNIYRAAEGIVRYFNGLGRPFSVEGWDNDRHWLRRAWTLQEIKTENSTINGGIPRDSAGATPNIMNKRGTGAKQSITLRRALRPVLKLAAEVDSPGGCSLYGLAREMSQRKATQATDKVAGLLYLLRLTQLPTYNENVSDEDAWTRCFHILPLPRKIELLFDFPYPGNPLQRWFPTWKQLLGWPELDPDCDYSPAAQAKDHRNLEKPVLADLGNFVDEVSLFLSDIWAISSSHMDLTPLAQTNDYNVRIKGKIYDFYSPYVKPPAAAANEEIQEEHPTAVAAKEEIQEEHPTTAAGPSEGTQQQQAKPLLTLVTPDLGHSSNWVLCEVVKKLKTNNKSTSGDSQQETSNSHDTPQDSIEVEIEVLKKITVLRTDFFGEILASEGRGDGSALRKINAIFV